MIHAHRKLDAWKNSMQLAKLIYDQTKQFPADEKYGLTSQMRRCAVSIPSNIAEGAARGTDPEFIHFLKIARGSLAELETQQILAKDLGFTKLGPDTEEKLNEVSGQINGLINHLKNIPGSEK